MLALVFDGVELMGWMQTIENFQSRNHADVGKNMSAAAETEDYDDSCFPFYFGKDLFLNILTKFYFFFVCFVCLIIYPQIL